MAINMDKFFKLTELSANNAAKSLTKLTGLKTSISILNVHIAKLSEQFNTLDSNAFVTAISLPVRGEVKGTTLLLFPKDVSMKLTSVLTKENNSFRYGFDEMEVSALKEVGNIVCGSFLTVIANKLKIHVVEHLPIFVFDTLATVLDGHSLVIDEDEEGALFIEVHFTFDEMNVSGHVIFVFSPTEMQTLEAAIDNLKIN